MFLIVTCKEIKDAWHGQLQPQWISPVGEQYLTKNEQIHRYIIKGDERATIWF